VAAFAVLGLTALLVVLLRSLMLLLLLLLLLLWSWARMAAESSPCSCSLSSASQQKQPIQAANTAVLHMSLGRHPDCGKRTTSSDFPADAYRAVEHAC
jgi:hypothetical protein